MFASSLLVYVCREWEVWGAETHKDQRLKKWAFRSVSIKTVVVKASRAAAALPTGSQPVCFPRRCLRPWLGLGFPVHLAPSSPKEKVTVHSVVNSQAMRFSKGMSD